MLEMNELCNDPNVRKLSLNEIRTRMEDSLNYKLTQYKEQINTYIFDKLKTLNDDSSNKVFYI